VSAIAAEDRVPERGDTCFRDYILTEYTPVCDPAGRLRAESIYRWALRRQGILDEAWPAVEALRTHLGQDQTVWGVKWGAAGFTSELYFYNNALNPPGHPMQVTALTAVLKPWLAIDTVMDESLPYFMCSIDLDAPTLASEAVGWHIYLGSGDKNRVQCGFSYLVHGVHHQLENHYWFYSPKTQLDDVRGRLYNSPRFRSPAFARLIPEYLLDCETICIAVKPRHDCIYTARITTAQLLRFLEENKVAELAALFAHHPDDFAHLRWDLGYDVTLDDNGDELIEKVGIYGVL